jgi:hypothetical protein
MSMSRGAALLVCLAAFAGASVVLAAADETGGLTLTGFGPEHAVYVSRVDGSAPTAYVTRDADGRATLEWSSGAHAVVFQAEARTATLEGLPAGIYTVRWWNGQTRAVGKTLLSGVGMMEDVTVGASTRHLSLTPPDGVVSPTRLNVVWGDVGLPAGVTIAVDDAFVGQAFDSAELSVFGLGKGERRVTLVADGYRPVSFTVSLDTQRESTRFVRFQPLPARQR